MRDEVGSSSETPCPDVYVVPEGDEQDSWDIGKDSTEDGPRFTISGGKIHIPRAKLSKPKVDLHVGIISSPRVHSVRRGWDGDRISGQALYSELFIFEGLDGGVWGAIL